VIPIVHSISPLALNNEAMITIKTHMDFIRSYEKMDKDKDISIIMHTVGGSLSSAEAICNCILNHKKSGYKGQFIIYIPYYAYSGGCMISLACDKIIMGRNAIMGPCDAQKMVTTTAVHSVASIIDTVKYKKEMKEKNIKEEISETWLAGSYDAELCKKRQLKYVNKLVSYERFSEDVGEVIYAEFFSGKYNHDQIFSAEDTQNLGLNVEIINEMPPIIKGIMGDMMD
jgi:ClpP class serine protease